MIHGAGVRSGRDIAHRATRRPMQRCKDHIRFLKVEGGWRGGRVTAGGGGGPVCHSGPDERITQQHISCQCCCGRRLLLVLYHLYALKPTLCLLQLTAAFTLFTHLSLCVCVLYISQLCLVLCVKQRFSHRAQSVISREIKELQPDSTHGSDPLY